MDGYRSDSCNALERLYYRPIEAALRWCGLIEHESLILAKLGGRPVPSTDDFPQWPCLRVNVEKIFDAVNHGVIVVGRDGRPVAPGEHVAHPRVTIRHEHLREWMSKYYPGQKPAFLFDQIERETHDAISTETFLSKKSQIETLQRAKSELEAKVQELINANEQLSCKFEASAKHGVGKELNPRLESTYRSVIAALLDCVLGESGFLKHPDIKNITELVEKIATIYRGYPGMSERNLSEKFGEIRKEFQSK